MAAAARRPAPIYVFSPDVLVGKDDAGKGEDEGWAESNLNVDNGNLTGKPGEGWAPIEIAHRRAYGCGENLRQALDGLSLCVRLGDGSPLVVTSTLGLRMSRDARDRFNSELGLDARNEHEMPPGARIMTQEQQGLLIMVLLFEHDFRDNLSCYLVYDRTDASLSMISWLPDSIEIIELGMFRPVTNRTPDGAFELFLMACECDDYQLPLSSEHGTTPFLCVFSPLTGTTSPTCAWEMRRTVRWNVPDSVSHRFRADATFSFQGKGFWADLSQVLVCCDLHSTSDDNDSAVDFGCIELPGECQLELEEMLDCTLPMKVTRTVGVVGDSIWFVCVHRSERDDADDSVTVWSLGHGGQWKNEARFHVRDLWRFDGFKEAGLPKAKVGYPLLTKDDGVLCLVVTGQFLGAYADKVSSVDHICTFDFRNKRLLWNGTVHDHIFTETAAFPPDFFERKHGSHKRKFDELHPAPQQGLALPPGSDSTPSQQ